jgi:hypothetical protein
MKRRSASIDNKAPRSGISPAIEAIRKLDRLTVSASDPQVASFARLFFAGRANCSPANLGRPEQRSRRARSSLWTQRSSVRRLRVKLRNGFPEPWEDLQRTNWAAGGISVFLFSASLQVLVCLFVRLRRSTAQVYSRVNSGC